MVKRFCPFLINFFLFFLLFIVLNSLNPPPTFAQSCTDWWPTVSSIPSCSQPLFQPDCNGSGNTTGSQCCTNIGWEYCENQTINQPALRYQFRCCNNAPTPPPPTPSPTPSPSCVQTPGFFASYDGCISGGYSRFNYYNCDGSTFSADYPNPDCNYLNPLPPCDAGQVCDSCTLIASGNACSGNGTQSCVYTTSTTGGACEPVSVGQTCNVNNCSTGYICNNGGCVPSTYCGNGACDIGESCSSCFQDCSSFCPSNPTPSPSTGTDLFDDPCTAAGYVLCTPGEAAGYCMSGGLVCTSYATYSYNCGGQNYCDPNASNCDIPCDGSTCGDGRCDASEGQTCPVDCDGGSTCGDGRCDASEGQTCPIDCNGGSGGTCTFSACGGNGCPGDNRYVSGDTCSTSYSWYTNPGCYSDTSCPGGGGSVDGSTQTADLVCRETVSKDSVNWSNNVTVNKGETVYFKMQISNSGNGIPWYGTRNNFQETIDGYNNIWQNSIDPLGSVFWLIRSADGISWDNNYYDSGADFCPGCIDTTEWSEVVKSDGQTFKNAGYGAVSLYVQGGNYWSGCRPEAESGGQTCISFPDGCGPSYSAGCAYNGTYQCNKVTVNVVEPTVPISGYIRSLQTEEGIQGVVVQVYDNNLGSTRSSIPSLGNGSWMVDKFVRPGDWYAVQIPGPAPTDYILPPKTSTYDHSWNFRLFPNTSNPGTNPWSDTPWGSSSYQNQVAGNWDCAGADGAGVTGRCNFVYDRDWTEQIPPPPVPSAVIGPWIQTTGGDVHSNTRINTPGGP